MRITRENVKLIEYLIMLVILACALLILLSIVAYSTTVNESIIITINNSTDWRTNLSTCCNWMG